jgi:hypothetical protein
MKPQVKSRLGGQVRIIISGGAPLAAHVEEFLRVAMCAPVAQVGLGGAVWGPGGGVWGGMLREDTLGIDPAPAVGFADLSQSRVQDPNTYNAHTHAQPTHQSTQSTRTPHTPPHAPTHTLNTNAPTTTPPQGYGLTECCAGAAIAEANNWGQFATNGPPLPCIEIRFESVPGGLLAGCVCTRVCAAKYASAVLPAPQRHHPTPNPNPQPPKHQPIIRDELRRDRPREPGRRGAAARPLHV